LREGGGEEEEEEGEGYGEAEVEEEGFGGEDGLFFLEFFDFGDFGGFGGGAGGLEVILCDELSVEGAQDVDVRGEEVQGKGGQEEVVEGGVIVLEAHGAESVEGANELTNELRGRLRF